MPGKWGDDWQQWAGPVPPHPPQPRWDKGWAGWARWARWGCWAGWGGWEDRSGCAERSGGSEDVKDAGAWKDRIGWADWSGWAEDVKSLEVAKEVHPDTHGPWRLGCRCLGPIGDPDDDDLDKDGGICSLGSVFQRCWTCEGLLYFHCELNGRKCRNLLCHVCKAASQDVVVRDNALMVQHGGDAQNGVLGVKEGGSPGLPCEATTPASRPSGAS